MASHVARLLALSALSVLFLSAAVRQVIAGPCTVSNPVPEINIAVEGDFAKRAKYPATQLVRMFLTADIKLKAPLVLDGKFNCTVLRSKGTKKYTLSATDKNYPPMRIVFASNILVNGINVQGFVPLASNPDCQYLETRYLDFIGKWKCPAIWLYRVWAVQVTQGRTYGRIEVSRAAHTRIDSMTVNVHPLDYPGAIVVMLSGDGPNLIRSNVLITNNNMVALGKPGTGAEIGLMLYRNAVGVNVNNNRMSEFKLASLQIGFGQSNVGDAMLNNVMRNNMVHTFGTNGDAAGIYVDTHWVNPGNILRCNYVRRGEHCLYLDWVSSGVIVDGLVCDKTADGLKLNTGKYNHVRGMVVIDASAFSVGYISCQNYNVNNCDKPNGQKWNAELLKSYQTPGIKKFFPYLTNFCAKTALHNINCNLGTTSQYGAAVTGRCSGLPTENYAEIVSAMTDGSTKWVFYQDNCKPFPAVPKLNTLRYFATSLAKAGFTNAKGLDFSLTKASPIRKAFPGFRSCPTKRGGPRKVNFNSYMNLFNIDRPADKPITSILTYKFKPGKSSTNPASVASVMNTSSSSSSSSSDKTSSSSIGDSWVMATAAEDDESSKLFVLQSSENADQPLVRNSATDQSHWTPELAREMSPGYVRALAKSRRARGRIPPRVGIRVLPKAV
ncbi:hypothetical protein CLOM_g17160 [Closterium sp. NIES-68]|nr:hypothetical protein CLOM_g17160 [Closterium sp. NIES-68]GJP63176.1 hypothetical protein CLOP_g20245 [Closterium sp. NIES-67]